MRRRSLYVLLFGAPALLVALFASLFLFGAAAGFLWLFVFGDNPWPEAAGFGLGAGFVAAFLAIWMALLGVAFAVGRREEEQPVLNKKHVALAVGSTVLLLIAATLHQRGVGNVGAPTRETACTDFCRAKGFSGSGMPPRNTGSNQCSCYDATGREAIKTDLGAR